MAVKRKNSTGAVYYHCMAHYRKWLLKPCPFDRCIPATWDSEIWNQIRGMLMDEGWVRWQLNAELEANKTVSKLITRAESRKNLIRAKINKMQDGYDSGFYTLEDAKKRKANYQEDFDKQEEEITRLKSKIKGLTEEEVQSLQNELVWLRDHNLEKPTFEEKMDLMARLNIKIYPSEDLKSRRITCQLNLKALMNNGEQAGVAKAVFGEPCRDRTCDHLIKSQEIKSPNF